jgi:hypothetical protein
MSVGAADGSNQGNSNEMVMPGNTRQARNNGKQIAILMIVSINRMMPVIQPVPMHERFMPAILQAWPG